MKKSFYLAIAAYLFPTFPLGYFWHLSWFAEQYHQLNLYRPDVIIPMGLTSMLIQAVLFAWSYPRLFGQLSWQAGAAKFAVMFGLLAWSFTTLPIAAKYQMTSVTNFMWLETSFTILQFAVVAPLIALSHQGDRHE